MTPYRDQVKALQRALAKNNLQTVNSRQFNQNQGPRRHHEQLFTISLETVDSMQGGEADIVIFSTVRANAPSSRSSAPAAAAASSSSSSSSSTFHQIGFLSDQRRMNVALTRAKRAMYVVGNAGTLRGDQNWTALIENAQSRHLLSSVSDIDSFFHAIPQPAPSPVLSSPSPAAVAAAAAAAAAAISASAYARYAARPPISPHIPGPVSAASSSSSSSFSSSSSSSNGHHSHHHHHHSRSPSPLPHKKSRGDS